MVALVCCCCMAWVLIEMVDKFLNLIK